MSKLLSGDLKDFSILDLLQLLEKTKSSGKLTIKGKNVTGTIFINKGEVIDATFEKLEGQDALKDIIIVSDGFFVFDKAPVKRERRINISRDEILMQLSEFAERWKKIKKEIVSIDAIPQFETTIDNDKISLSRKAVKIIPLINGDRSLREIAESLNISYFDTADIVFGLIDKSLAKIKEIKKITTVEPVKLTVQIVHNLLEGEDGTWMSRILGMAPESLIDEFEDEYVVWLDAELVGKWEQRLKKRINSVVAMTPRYDGLVLRISPQISLKDNIVFHDKLAGKYNLKEGDVVEVTPNL